MRKCALARYQSECLPALKSAVNIHKPFFEKAFMDAMRLFMAVPDRMNLLLLGGHGCFSERTCRDIFGMRHSTGLRSTVLSSASVSQAKEKPSPSPFLLPSQARRHLESVSSGLVAREIIRGGRKSWASVSLTSIQP